MVLLILSSLLLITGLAYVLLIGYLLNGWRRIDYYFSSGQTEYNTKVSVLIAARDEEKNIESTIESLMKQDYPRALLEIIIVDDHSEDRTAEIIESYASDGVQLIRLNESELLNSYKKIAIARAIEDSTGELIVVTDADCIMGTEWLATIVSFYEEKQDYLISSPVVYHNEESIFQKLQTLEFLYLIGLGAASIGNKQPSTCNGANLAYRKDVFLELGGFEGIDDLASGDDELFLHKVAQVYPNKIGFCKSDKAIVYTEGKKTLGSFIAQRKRWASKSTHYKRKSIVYLGVSVWLFNVFLGATLIISIFNASFWMYFALCFGAKVLIELLFIKDMTSFSNRNKLLLFLPLLSWLHIFYLIYIGIAGNSGKYQWKGRMVR